MSGCALVASTAGPRTSLASIFFNFFFEFSAFGCTVAATKESSYRSASNAGGLGMLGLPRALLCIINYTIARPCKEALKGTHSVD